MNQNHKQALDLALKSAINSEDFILAEALVYMGVSLDGLTEEEYGIFEMAIERPR